jgi:hypothetical protein
MFEFKEGELKESHFIQRLKGGDCQNPDNKERARMENLNPSIY